MDVYSQVLSTLDASTQNADLKLNSLKNQLHDQSALSDFGKLTSAVGTVLRSTIQNVKIGDLCLLIDEINDIKLHAEVVALDKNEVVLIPLGGLQNLSKKVIVKKTQDQFKIPVGDWLLSKVIDGYGNVIGEMGKDSEPVPSAFLNQYPVMRSAPDSLSRPIVSKTFLTGIASIDTFITCAKGQRLAIFAGPGMGKTTLMGMIIRGSEADVIVVSLIGERGREVREFIDLELTEEIRKKVVLVVSTSDKPPVEQVKSAFVAQTIAEYFRDQGKNVLLFMDSVTRLARAQREVGLSSGEPATRGGFPPSVFLTFPKLMERAGTSEKGSITAFYTVLMEGESTQKDPIADEVKSIIDGHIVLSKKFVEQGQFPAIGILTSLSRVADRIITKKHLEAARKIRLLLSKHEEIEFLVRVGEYHKGADPIADEAMRKYDSIMKFLKQGIHEHRTFESCLQKLHEIAGI